MALSIHQIEEIMRENTVRALAKQRIRNWNTLTKYDRMKISNTVSLPYNPFNHAI